MNPLVIAHRLDKEANGTNNADTRERDDVYNLENSATQRLIAGAKNGVNRSSSIGCFEREADDQPKILERLITQFSQNESKSGFIAFSKFALNALFEKINSKSKATGGYVLFVYYESETGEQAGQRYMVIALVTDQQVPAFDEELNLLDSTVLDLENLKHGARVKMSKLEDNSDGVVSLLPSKRASVTAEYFSEFIGCNHFTNSKKMAERLDERLIEWCDAKEMTPEQRSSLRFQVHSHWQTQDGAKNGISIVALGNSLYPEDSTEFVNFMTDENLGIPGQTPRIRSIDMGRFKKYRFARVGLKLEFDTGGENNWLNNFKIDGENLVLEKAPDDLIGEIRKLKQGDE